jgi:hypothetical protein
VKGPRELKLYVSRFRKELNAGHWDDLLIFKLDKCKKWYKRDKQLYKRELDHE